MATLNRYNPLNPRARRRTIDEPARTGSPAVDAALKHDDIPAHLLTDPVEPEAVWERGSLGSPVLALRGGHPEALRCLADLYAKRFRKGWRGLKARTSA